MLVKYLLLYRLWKAVVFEKKRYFDLRDRAVADAFPNSTWLDPLRNAPTEAFVNDVVELPEVFIGLLG